MMSARPRRAISSRMAGVSVVAGTFSPYHPVTWPGRCRRITRRRLGGGQRGATGFDADRRVGARVDGPVRVLLPGEVAAVRRAVRQVPEPERPPGRRASARRTAARTRTARTRYDSSSTPSRSRRRSRSGTSSSASPSSHSRSVATNACRSPRARASRTHAAPGGACCRLVVARVDVRIVLDVLAEGAGDEDRRALDLGHRRERALAAARARPW